MSFLDSRLFGNVLVARRTFLGISGVGLSGAAVALLTGRETLAAEKGSGSAVACSRARY